MKEMRLVLLVNGIDYASKGFVVHDQHASEIVSIIRDKFDEIAKDFDFPSSEGSP